MTFLAVHFCGRRNKPFPAGVQSGMLTPLLLAISRFLLSASKAGAALVLGFFGLVILAFIFEQARSPLARLIFLFGFALTAYGAVAFGRRLRAWKIRHDAQDWERRKAQRKLHPAWSGTKRLASQILIWVPSLISAFVLLFFPLATHLLLPHPRNLGSYHIPIPWTYPAFPLSRMMDLTNDVIVVDVLIVSGENRFGLTPLPVPPLWRRYRPVSRASFALHPSGTGLDIEMFKATSTTPPLRKEFRMGEISLDCWELRSRWYNSRFSVWCRHPQVAEGPHLSAIFIGRQEDVGAFYQIVERITRVPTP